MRGCPKTFSSLEDVSNCENQDAPTLVNVMNYISQLGTAELARFGLTTTTRKALLHRLSGILLNLGVICGVSLVIEGDSMCAHNIGYSDYFDINRVGTANAGFSNSVFVSARGGRCCSDPDNLVAEGETNLCDYAATIADTYRNDFYAYNILVLLVTNDLAYYNASNTYDHITAYGLARQAAGWYTIICTLPPRAGDIWEPKRLALNVSLRADHTGYDALIDVGADPIMGDHATATNLTYFLADGVHHTPAGRAVIAQVVRDGIISILT